MSLPALSTPFLPRCLLSLQTAPYPPYYQASSNDLWRRRGRLSPYLPSKGFTSLNFWASKGHPLIIRFGAIATKNKKRANKTRFPAHPTPPQHVHSSFALRITRSRRLSTPTFILLGFWVSHFCKCAWRMMLTCHSSFFFGARSPSRETAPLTRDAALLEKHTFWYMTPISGARNAPPMPSLHQYVCK